MRPPLREAPETSPRASGAQIADASRLTLSELTKHAGVSVRTVRYYIAEGLLPPADGSGPHASYGGGHLDRLRLIQRMKGMYLPLKEIRRRLAGLDDDAVRKALQPDRGVTDANDDGGEWDVSLASARDYLAVMEAREPYHTEPLALTFQESALASAGMAGPAPARSRPPRPTGVFPARPPAAPLAADETQPLWHRLRLGDEAELVISERVYARHRDRVDWLVRWARKVFG